MAEHWATCLKYARVDPRSSRARTEHRPTSGLTIPLLAAESLPPTMNDNRNAPAAIPGHGLRCAPALLLRSAASSNSVEVPRLAKLDLD